MTKPPDGYYTAFLKGSLKLDCFGIWHHDDRPFANDKLAALFHRSIIWDETTQCYLIQIGRQRAEFDVEDTAWFVMLLDDVSYPWKLVLSDGSTEAFRPDAVSVGHDGQFYHLVKGGHRARLSRPAHQRLLDHACSEREILVNGKRIQLPGAESN
jgi:hypothetical protein